MATTREVIVGVVFLLNGRVKMAFGAIEKMGSIDADEVKN